MFSPGMSYSLLEIAVRRTCYFLLRKSYSLFEFAVRSTCYFVTRTVFL